jgi:hypothetical protein
LCVFDRKYGLVIYFTFFYIDVPSQIYFKTTIINTISLHSEISIPCSLCVAGLTEAASQSASRMRRPQSRHTMRALSIRRLTQRHAHSHRVIHRHTRPYGRGTCAPTAACIAEACCRARVCRASWSLFCIPPVAWFGLFVGDCYRLPWQQSVM